MLKRWKFIIDNKHLSARKNMQKDKELFESFKDGDTPVFRIYNWQKCFTYGVSQDIKKIDLDYGDDNAKRITGGGILLHGHDISYSIITDTKSLKGMNVKKSYEYFCEFILEFYRFWGLKPVFAKDIESIELSKNIFCQVGFEPYDIIINGKKIGGNAQKRGKNKLLQHGSIPVNHISHPFGGYSLEDIGVHLSEDKVIKELKSSFKKTFHCL